MLTDTQISEILKGSPSSDSYKHPTLVEYGRRFNRDVFVETGTHVGEGMQATKNHFSEVYSIEVQPVLYANAKKRFEKDSNVHILFGNSEEVFKQLLPTIADRKLLFYLDAHFAYDGIRNGSGAFPGSSINNPTLGELDAILTLCPDCVILIDDARLFTGGMGEYDCSPSLKELEHFITMKRPDLVFQIERDMMRIHKESHD